MRLLSINRIFIKLITILSVQETFPVVNLHSTAVQHTTSLGWFVLVIIQHNDGRQQPRHNAGCKEMAGWLGGWGAVWDESFKICSGSQIY